MSRPTATLMPLPLRRLPYCRLAPGLLVLDRDQSIVEAQMVSLFLEVSADRMGRRSRGEYLVWCARAQRT